MTERVVHFFSDGFRLEADYLLPEGTVSGAKLPAIMLLPGFGANRFVIQPDYAAHFVAAGYAVLSIDYRGFGGSEGDPTRLIGREQAEDIRAALSWLALQPEVDPDRLGLWGTSGGGAHAVYVTGIDERVRCAVGQVGYGDGERLIRDHKTPDDYAHLLADLAADSARRALTGKSETMRVIDLITTPTTRAFVLEAAKTDPSIISYITMQSAEAALHYRPIDVAHRIGPRAMLLIAAEQDDLCLPDGYRAVYGRLTGPKKWVSYPLGHYDIYAPDWVETSANEAIAWYREHL
jgi:uncharacterized protein